MIQAKDLRIGNWVKLDKYFYKVYSVNPLENKLIDKDKIIISGWYVDGIKPIQLTEEILLKCGFKKINKIYFRKGALTIEVQSFGHFRVSFDGKMLVNLKHLHQLQNLYFALSNEELNIEL